MVPSRGSIGSEPATISSGLIIHTTSGSLQSMRFDRSDRPVVAAVGAAVGGSVGAAVGGSVGAAVGAAVGIVMFPGGGIVIFPGGGIVIFPGIEAAAVVVVVAAVVGTSIGAGTAGTTIIGD